MIQLRKACLKRFASRMAPLSPVWTGIPAILANLIFLLPLCAGTFPGQNGLIAYSRGGEVWVVNPNGSDPHKIADGGDPAFSPDGRWIVFVDERNNETDLFVIRPDGTDERQITNNSNVIETSPSWLNNSTVIFKARSNGVEDPAARNIVRVAVGPTPTSVYTVVRGPQIPDSNSLVTPEASWNGALTFTEYYFWAPNRLKTGIYTATGGGAATMVSTFPETANSSGWSPTGNKVVYAEAVPGIYDLDVFTNNPGGGDPFNVTRTPSRRELDPRFSPDGGHIVFSDGNSLYVIDADGENEYLLVGGGVAGARDPDWGIVIGSEYTPTSPSAALKKALRKKIKKLKSQLKAAKRKKRTSKIKRIRVQIKRVQARYRAL